MRDFLQQKQVVDAKVHGAVTIPNHPIVLIWVRINFGKISTVGLSPRLIKTYVLKGRPAFPHSLPGYAYIRALSAHWELASTASSRHEQPLKHLHVLTCSPLLCVFSRCW